MLSLFGNNRLLAKYFAVSGLIMIIAAAAGYSVSDYFVLKAKRANEIAHLERASGFIQQLSKARGETPSQIFRHIQENFPPFMPSYLILIDQGQFISKNFPIPSQVSIEQISKETPQEPLKVSVLPSDSNIVATRFETGEILFRFLLPPHVIYPGYQRPPNNGPWGARGMEITHPVVFGVTPEMANFFIYSAVLVLGFFACLFACFALFRKTANQADLVLSELQAGNLNARFPTRDSNGIAEKFNLMADEIERLVLNLQKSEATRKELFQGLAHDLKTPVASLSSTLETFQDHGTAMKKEVFDDFLQTAVSETRYLGRLVEDLLMIARISEPEHPLKMEALHLAPLIIEEISAYAMTKIQFSFDPKSLAIIEGDSQAIRRLIRNAIDNAASFARSKVQIEISEDSASFFLMVMDDGPGLTEEALRDFGSRSRSRKVSSPSTGGRISIGLGSVIMKKNCELHGGSLSIENHAQDGIVSGAVLTIRLPKSFASLEA